MLIRLLENSWRLRYVNKQLLVGITANKMILPEIAYPAIINLESRASVYGGARADAFTERTLLLQLKGKTMPRTPDSRLRIEGFRKAEASRRLEGKDPSGTPLYKSVKARIILGELTYEQGRPEILAYYTKADTAGTVTVGEILTEEFLKALNMSHDELAEAMGFLGRMLAISYVGRVVKMLMRSAFLLAYLVLMRIFGVICRYCKIRINDSRNNNSYAIISAAPQVS